MATLISDIGETAETQMVLTIKTINGQSVQTKLNRQALGKHIKQHIYNHITQSLKVSQMELIHNQIQIQNQQSIMVIYMMQDKPFIIQQVKTFIWNTSCLDIEKDRQDPISCEIGVAKMCCGHYIGTQAMTQKIKALIATKKYEIRCGDVDEFTGKQCDVQWDFKVCIKVGIFTKEEVQQFQEGLSQNWIKDNCKSCPKCKYHISKINLNSNRVRCPNCDSSDFCYICLNEWIGGQSNCGNEECTLIVNFVQKSPKERQFWLTDAQDGYTKKSYMAPRYRLCPTCSNLIEHGQKCKHMTCNECFTEFCWICLSLENQTEGWPCGQPWQFCGRIAQNQRITTQ